MSTVRYSIGTWTAPIQLRCAGRGHRTTSQSSARLLLHSSVRCFRLLPSRKGLVERRSDILARSGYIKTQPPWHEPSMHQRTSASSKALFMTTYCSNPKHLKALLVQGFERQKTRLPLHNTQSKFPQRVRRTYPSSLDQGKARPGARVAVWAKDRRRPASEALPANKSDSRDQTTTPMAAALLPRRRLGATGLEISALGFGASPLGSVFQVRMS